MSKAIEKAEEILGETDNYRLTRHEYGDNGVTLLAVKDSNWPSQSGYRHCICDPFADTLEGRRQADAIEDWLSENHPFSWHQSSHGIEAPNSHHQWRLDRIKVALEQLGEQDE